VVAAITGAEFGALLSENGNTENGNTENGNIENGNKGLEA